MTHKLTLRIVFRVLFVQEEASHRSDIPSHNYEVDLEDSLQQLGNYVAEFQNELNRKLKQKADGTLITPRETKENEEFHDHSQLSQRMKRLSTGVKTSGRSTSLSERDKPTSLPLDSLMKAQQQQQQHSTTPHTVDVISPKTSPSRKLQFSSHDNTIVFAKTETTSKSTSETSNQNQGSNTNT
jgi:hypothetical protein